MSAAHANLVCRCQAFWANRDTEDLLELVADDAVLDLSRNIFNPDVYRGHDGVRRWVATVDEMWSDFEIEEAEIIGESDDTMVTATRMTGIGRFSGVPAEMEVWQVWTVRDGKVARMTGGFRSRDEALKAAGLRNATDPDENGTS